MEKNKLTVFIIEDEPAHIEAIRRSLNASDEEYNICTSTNLKEYHENAAKYSPDLVIADLNLPDGKAFEILTDNLENQPFPILLMTAYGDEEIAVRSIKSGALDYIVKSENAFLDMPHIVKRALREWHNIQKRKLAEEEIRKLNAELEKKVEERTAELVELNMEMESFSYSVSHDLKAPLRSMSGFSQILSDEYSDKFNDEGKTLISRIQNSCQLMDRLIEDLLSLSKVTKYEINYQTIDLTKIINHVINEFKKNNPKRKIKTIINQVPEVESDYNMLNIAFTNLIGNTWKFTEKKPDPIIEFGSKKDNNDTIYYIKDNGAGFDMVHADKLFGAFQRLHTQKEFPGTGIGLAIVKRIFKRLGGRIWAEAEIGKGATFYFVLPKKSNK